MRPVDAASNKISPVKAASTTAIFLRGMTGLRGSGMARYRQGRVAERSKRCQFPPSQGRAGRLDLWRGRVRRSKLRTRRHRVDARPMADHVEVGRGVRRIYYGRGLDRLGAQVATSQVGPLWEDPGGSPMTLMRSNSAHASRAWRRGSNSSDLL